MIAKNAAITLQKFRTLLNRPIRKGQSVTVLNKEKTIFEKTLKVKE